MELGTDSPSQSVEPADEEIDPFEKFKHELHIMVMETEELGTSALASLLLVRHDIRCRRNELMRENSQLEQSVRSATAENYQEIMKQFGDLQVDQILCYHKLKWIEGYIRDRLPD